MRFADEEIALKNIYLRRGVGCLREGSKILICCLLISTNNKTQNAHKLPRSQVF